MSRPKIDKCACGTVKTGTTCSIRSDGYFAYQCKACARKRVLLRKYDKMSEAELEELRITHAYNLQVIEDYMIERFD